MQPVGMAAARVFFAVGISLLATFAVLAVGGQCPQTIDGDYWGNNLQGFACKTPGECCDHCVGNTECIAWTHYDGVCYPKSAAANFHELKGAVSGHVPRPVPDLAFYTVFNASDPYSNCANQGAAPGTGKKFGDTCLYKVPLGDWQKKGQIGTAVSQTTTWQSVEKDDPNFYEIAPAAYFFGPPEDGQTSSIIIYGAILSEYSEYAIIGGTGAYRGVKGYVITGSSECNADKSICHHPKNVYLTSKSLVE